MKLKSFQIKNYRSIEDITIDIEDLDDKSFSYGLIGVNEAGKSTILKALALKEGLFNSKGEHLPLKKDFRNRTADIEVVYNYVLTKSESKMIKDLSRAVISDSSIEQLDFSQLELSSSFSYADSSKPANRVGLAGLSMENPLAALVNETLSKVIIENHKIIFWTAEDRFLISQPINLQSFSTNPDSVSIPLKNCFAMAGMNTIEQIRERILLIDESTERESLKDDLSRAVTSHINSIWKDHPIAVTFDISDGVINFHVHDLKTNGKAKTAGQRSDGFGQFVSFLLTISAQNKNNELRNTILLIDDRKRIYTPKHKKIC